MKIRQKGVFQISLVILGASFIAAGILINKIQFNNSIAAGGCSSNTTQRSCNNACSPSKGVNNQSFECKWVDGSCKEGARVCESGSDSSGNPQTVNCGTDRLPHIVNGSTYFYCGGCVNTCVRSDLLENGGCNAYVGARCGTGGYGECSQIVGSFTTYYCQGGTSAGAGCQDSDPIPSGVRFDSEQNAIIGHFCGVVQVDDGRGHYCSRSDYSACTNPTQRPTTTPIRSPSPSPTKSPSPKPTPTKSPSPSPTYSPSPTPVSNAKLKICKYDDRNSNGKIDDDEGQMVWDFYVNYLGNTYKKTSDWWNVINRGCVTLDVPVNQWVKVYEEYKSGWNLTGVYQDDSWVGTNEYSYIPTSNNTKKVVFLNNNSPSATGAPNSCNGTCGSNYNCQSSYFCYIKSGDISGFCRNPNCSTESSCNCPGSTSTPAPPQVLSATAPPVLPKTGSESLLFVLSSLLLGGSGIFIFRRFRLI